jgi:hypothetical protein
VNSVLNPEMSTRYPPGVKDGWRVKLTASRHLLANCLEGMGSWLNSINQLISVVEMYCASCEVRTKLLYIV